jgi:hypothetical protein
LQISLLVLPLYPCFDRFSYQTPWKRLRGSGV